MPQTFPEIFYLNSFILSKQSSCNHSTCQPSIPSKKQNRDRPSRFATASRNQPSPDGRHLFCLINLSLKKKTKNKSNTLSRTIYFTFGLPNAYHAVPCVKVHVKLKNIYIS